MAKQINFVSDRRKALTVLEERDKKWFGFTTKAVMVVFAVFLVALGARLFFAHQVKVIVDGQQSTRNAILAQEATEREYLIFAHKLKQLSQVFMRRQNKQEALKFFNDLFGSEIKVSEINYTSDGKSDTLDFTLRARSVFTVNEIFDKLNSEAVLSRFKNIKKQSLRRGNDGSYGIQITLVLGEGPVEEGQDASQEE